MSAVPDIALLAGAFGFLVVGALFTWLLFRGQPPQEDQHVDVARPPLDAADGLDRRE